MLVQLIRYHDGKTLVRRAVAGTDIKHGSTENDCGAAREALSIKNLWQIVQVSNIIEMGRECGGVMFHEADCWWLVTAASFVKIHPDNINNQEYLNAIKTIFNNRYYEEYPDERPE